MESKEVQVNFHKEMRSNHLKQLSFQMKGKDTADNLSLTINNSVNKKEAHVVNSHEVKAQENVQTSFKLVHNYPLNDNLKIKVRKI